MDAYGQVLNNYVSEHPLEAGEPDRPWAVNLTDTAGHYRLLAFDLDAKTPEAAQGAHRDAQTLAGLLTDAGLQAVVCESGPTGGRHVWTALAEPVERETVRILAEQTRRLCPTLDLSPLLNPVTGCVRPPGSPHRAGGRSTVLAGDLSALSAPTGTADQVRAVAERVIQLVGPVEPACVNISGPLPLDDEAHPYLPGPRRELPAASAAALSEDAASGDANVVLWRVLIGAASARWRYADVAQLIPTAPGLEHVRTERVGGRRVARGRVRAQRVLTRQWGKAVAYVGSSPRQHGDDPTYDERAHAIAADVGAVQARADATAGRWATRSGPGDRRILDALSLLALTALSASVEADTRRLALLAGVGRETARTALLRLADEGWITQTRTHEGPHGAHWTFVHSPVVTDRSQAVPRPAGAGAAQREALTTTLTRRLAAARHDLFTHQRALGHHAGNTYARVTDQAQSTVDLARFTGDSPSSAADTLGRLAAAGVIVRARGGWRRTSQDRRDSAATQFGVHGRLADREVRYASERELWAWWLAELAWMTAPGRHGRRRRCPTVAQPALALGHVWDLHPPMPREHGKRGRVVWADARAVISRAKPVKPVRTLHVDQTVQLLRDVLGAELVA